MPLFSLFVLLFSKSPFSTQPESLLKSISLITLTPLSELSTEFSLRLSNIIKLFHGLFSRDLVPSYHSKKLSLLTFSFLHLYHKGLHLYHLHCFLHLCHNGLLAVNKPSTFLLKDLCTHCSQNLECFSGREFHG